MPADRTMLDMLVAKDAIRELVLLYSRACDRQDFDLVATLYTGDATDSHDETFDGPASDYVAFLARSLPHTRYSGHHVCNHLISVDVDRGEGEGEVYAIAVHAISDGESGWIEDLMCCRYIDRYRQGEDGRWRFARRIVTYDYRNRRTVTLSRPADDPAADSSYAALSARLFERGGRR